MHWFTFAADHSGTTHDLTVAAYAAVAMGVVLGIFKGIEMLRAKWSKDTKDATGNPQLVHWTDLTGEQRPVTKGECDKKHADMSDDLRRGREKFDKQADSIQKISVTMTELRGEMRTGFAELGKQVIEAVESGVDKHERQWHRSRSTGTHSKPSS